MRSFCLLFIFLGTILSGCTDFKNKKAVKEMIKRHPELYPDAKLPFFEKGISICLGDSVNMQLYLSAHQEQQYVVLSKPGRDSYAIPFPEYNHEYLHFEGLKHSKHSNTLAHELQTAAQTLYPDNLTDAQYLYKGIFSGLLGARPLIKSDSIYLKANITRFTVPITRKILLYNYKSIFKRFNDDPSFRPDVYVCAPRGEIYEVIYDYETKGFPYKINIYWNPIIED